jgi:hypothetical protein
MYITDKVKIGGLVYTVKKVDKCKSDNRNTDGMIHYDEGIIELQKDMQGDYLSYVFIHEIVHGIYDFLCYEQDEKIVDQISRALHMVIKDNPEIFKGGDNDAQNT